MTQSAITIVAELAEARHGVRERLVTLGERVRNKDRALAPLFDARRIHFLSFFTFGDGARAAAYVVLEVNCDGRRAPFLRWLADTAPELLETLFGECVGFPAPASTAAVARFLRAHDAGADAFYIGCPGRSVAQIELERKLREESSQLLETLSGQVTATEVWRNVQALMKGRLDDVGRATRPLWIRWSLHPKGAPQQLRRLLPLLMPPTLQVLGLLGFGTSVLAASVLPPLSAALALAPPIAAAAYTAALWHSERPYHANQLGKAVMHRAFLEIWGNTTIDIAVAIGLATLVPLFVALSPLALSLGIGALGGLVIAAAAAFVYVASGRLPAALFALTTGSLWGALVALNLCNPLLLAPIGLAGSLALLTPAAAATACLLLAIRRAELKDVDGELAWDIDHLEAVTKHEDAQLQNHLVTVTELREGRTRLIALKVVLRAISLAAKLYYNQGELGRISQIHFGRFVIQKHKGKRRLLFMGNYDGGFGTYLGAFRDVLGTTAVWSNTVGFPRSYFLIEDGGRDEQRFKAFGRRSQVETLGWFSAYEGLSVQDIDAASANRDALGRTVGAPTGLWQRIGNAAASLRHGAGLLQPLRTPLDEAACDAALRRL